MSSRRKRRTPPAPASGRAGGRAEAAAGPTASTARRLPILIVSVATALAILGWWALRAPAFAIGTSPDRNVLLVTIDTLRADALGSYGGRATTPNLDRLAAHGARFAFAHSHAVVTLVSHSSIMTGLYPYQHGVRDNTGYRLPQTSKTAATLLKADGFATGAFIGGFTLDHRFGLGLGFDVYDDHLGQSTSTLDTDDRERTADKVVAPAMAWIAKQPGKWFTWVHVYDPHAPYAPPPEWANRFPSDPYLGEVSWTDAALGPLFDSLASQPRPTLVVVTGDHGESLGEHGEATHSIFAYEATLHVPLIVAEIAPGQAEAGTRGEVIETPVRHVDLLPTLLEAVGARVPDGLPGRSLQAVVDSSDTADRPSYFEAMTSNVARGWAPLRGVLVGREKYIDLPIPELYDLSADPKELRNLAASEPTERDVLLNTLKSFDMSPPGRPRLETPDTLEKLRSLGYIGGGVGPVRETYTEADDPKNLIQLEQMMTQAAAAYEQGRPTDAIDLYKRVIATRADTEDAYRKLALIYWRAGMASDAIAVLEDALRHGVTQSEVRIKLGEYLTQSGQAQRAIDLLQTFAGDDPDALIALGNAYEAAGRGNDALRTFRHLIDVDPASALARQNIGVAYLRARNFAEAERALRDALAIDSGSTGALTALGVVLANTNRRAEAIDTWKHVVDLDAGNLDALYNLTLNLADAGRNDDARSYGQRFLTLVPPTMAQDAATIRRVLDSIK